MQELDALVSNAEDPIRRLTYEIDEFKAKHEGELRVIAKALSELQYSRDTLEKQNSDIQE